MSSSFLALRNPQFRPFALGVFISQTGSEMTKVAVVWQLYQLTGSVFMLGLIGVFRFIPLIIGTQVIGVIADRRNRKKLLYLALLGTFSMALLLGVVSYSGLVTPWKLLLCIAGFALFNSCELVIRNAILPNILTSRELSSGIAVKSTLDNIRQFIGPLIAGFAIASVPIHLIYFLDALSTVFLMLLLIPLRLPKLAIRERVSLVQSYIEGAKYVVRTRAILYTTLLDFAIMFFTTATSLLPAIADRIYRVGPQELGLMYSSLALGGIMTGSYLSYRHHLRNLRKTLITTMVVISLGTIILGLGLHFVVALFGLFLIGSADTVSAVIRNHIRQTLTPDHLRARMNSLTSLFFIGGPYLGDMEAGFVAALIGLLPSVLLGGSFGLIVAGCFYVLLRKVEPELVQLETTSTS